MSRSESGVMMNTQTWREMWIVTRCTPESAMAHCLANVLNNKEFLKVVRVRKGETSGVEVAPVQGLLLFA